FFRRDASERHYVFMGRVVTALLMICAALLTFTLDTAKESFELILSVGAGTGLIYLLRWFWWRINAWSEVSAMASSFLVALGFFVARKSGHPVAPHVALIATVAATTIVWVAVTYATRPVDRATLVGFYRLVRPAGPGWEPVRREAGTGPSPDSLSRQLLGWVLGCLLVYSALFGAGRVLYGEKAPAAARVGGFPVRGVRRLRLVPALWASRA